MASNNTNPSKNYYTCSPYSTPQLLRTSGEEPIELTISYLYELDYVDLPTATTATTSLDLAVQHVSLTLLHRIATISNLANCSSSSSSSSSTNNDNAPFRLRQRKLRFKGRGSNSLIGIVASSNVDNSIASKEQQVCQFEMSGVEIKEMEQFVEGVMVTGDFSGSVVEAEGEAEEEDQQQLQQQLGGREEDNTTPTDVLAVTRVDGVIDPTSVILRSAPIPNHQVEENKAEGGDDGGDGAYNYLSTQSEIKEAESIRTQPTNNDNVTLRQNSVNNMMIMTMTPPKLRSGGMAGTKCNVVQGEITLFISNTADPYENLDGRILEAIKDDLNDEMILQQEFLKDGVVGLRLLEPAMAVPDDRLPSSPTISVATPSVTAAAAASSSASSPSNMNETGGSSGFASSSASIGVIGGLAAIFLMLIGLFAYTSRPRKRRYILGEDDQLNSAHDIYESELDAVSAVLSGKDSASLWWQEPIRMNDSFDSRSIMEASVPTVEACYSSEGVIISNDDIDEAFADSSSPKKLPLSFFNRRSKSRDEMDGTSNLVAGELIKSDSLLDEDESTVDMDAHLFHDGAVKSKKSKSFKRFFGRKRTADMIDDAIIDEDIVIEEIQSRAESQSNEVLIQESYSQDAFGIETTRTAPLRPMDAYVSPTTIRSRSRSRLSDDDYAERILQSCSSGAFSSCLPYDFPPPEIGDEQSNVSALTDNYFDQNSRRGPPGCTDTDGAQLMRAVTQCVAPTDDTSVPTSVAMKQKQQQQQRQQQQLARRQPNLNTLDTFADCWNPFEGNFWQGWFD
eukprot:scaffold5266_cov138-Skeletonema_menzelii.AAC.3